MTIRVQTEGGLLDRERELALADEAMTRIEAGEGQTLLVEGPPGIGKSALLNEIAEDGRRRGFEVLQGRAGQYERDLPWGLVTDLFGPLLGSMDPEQRQDLFTEAASLAAPLFGFASKAPASPNSLSAALHGLYWLTVGIADRYGKVILAIDDLHWADEPSIRWLGRLATRIDELPVLIVATIRTSEPGAAEVEERLDAIAPGTESLLLGALTNQGSQALVAQLFGREPAPEFATACHHATGGNPLLLRELIVQMQATGTEPTAEASSHVPEVDSRSVARSFLARLGQLSPGAKSLATGAAVLQGRPRVDEAAELMEMEREEAIEAADELIAAGLIDDGAELTFTHPIVQNAVYEDMSRHRRSGIELRAAKVRARRGAAPGQVASHLLAVAPAADPWVVDQLRRAAEDGFEKGAPDVAVSYLGRALEERPPDSDQAAIVFQMALAQFGAGAIPQSFESFERALKLSRTDEQRVEVGLSYARRQAILLTGQGVVIAEKLHSGLEKGTALAARAEAEVLELAIYHTGRFPSARARLFELRSDESIEDPQLLAAMAGAALASAEPIDASTELCRRAVANGLGSFDLTGTYLNPLATVVSLYLAEHFDEAAELLTQWIDDASRAGAPVMYAIGSSFRSDLNYRRGRVAEGEADARSSVRLFTEAGVQYMTANGSLAEALVERDELDEALDVMEGTDIPNDPVLWNDYAARFSRARVKIAAGQFEAALEDLEPFADPEAMAFDFVALLPWRSTAALCHDRLGEHDLARSLVADELRLVRRSESPRAIGITQMVQGMVAEKENEVAILRDAVRTLETTEAGLEHARAEVALGAALRRAGQRREAREVLKQGLDRARVCGGLRLVRLAREELGAAGARPRRDELHGRDALTASELRVASLAAGELTNAQIAQQLFVTRRTVETHLTHAYQKLEISGRQELAGAMAAAQSSDLG